MLGFFTSGILRHFTEMARPLQTLQIRTLITFYEAIKAYAAKSIDILETYWFCVVEFIRQQYLMSNTTGSSESLAWCRTCYQRYWLAVWPLSLLASLIQTGADGQLLYYRSLRARFSWIKSQNRIVPHKWHLHLLDNIDSHSYWRTH